MDEQVAIRRASLSFSVNLFYIVLVLWWQVFVRPGRTSESIRSTHTHTHTHTPCSPSTKKKWEGRSDVCCWAFESSSRVLCMRFCFVEDLEQRGHKMSWPFFSFDRVFSSLLFFLRFTVCRSVLPSPFSLPCTLSLSLRDASHQLEPLLEGVTLFLFLSLLLFVCVIARAKI